MHSKELKKSIEWYEKCRKIIPASCSTLAKTPSRLVKNHSPYCCVSGNGSHFKDIDGNVWLDCEMAMGTVVWGYNPLFLSNALIKQVKNGLSFSIAEEKEYQYAQLLLRKFYWYDSVKFFKNGADAVYAAIRLSRFLSKKDKVLSCEYHGWHSWCCFHYYHKAPKECGIPNEILHTSLYCSPDKELLLKRIDEEKSTLACVVLCPSSFSKNDLSEIMKNCSENDIFVIFDEVTSGIRYGYKGVTGKYDLYPDFLCLSKGLTNGLPLAFCLGKNKNVLIMEQLKISNAHSSESLSLAAAIACEHEMANCPIWPTWETTGREILENIQLQIEKCGLINQLFLKGYPGNFYIYSQADFYSDPFREHLIKDLSSEGIFSKGYILFSAAHTKQEMNLTKQVICNSIEKYANSL